MVLWLDLHRPRREGRVRERAGDLKDQKPLNNTRWMLFRRGPRVEALQADLRETRAAARRRPPTDGCSSPPTRLSPSPVPTTAASPQVLQFNVADPAAPPATLLPPGGHPPFTEHSYRASADGPNRELLLLNIRHEARVLELQGPRRQLEQVRGARVPMGNDYEVPRAITSTTRRSRQNRAAHVMGVNDISGERPGGTSWYSADRPGTTTSAACSTPTRQTSPRALSEWIGGRQPGRRPGTS